MTNEEALAALKIDLKTLNVILDDAELQRALDKAYQETGWKSGQINKPFREYWLLQRGVRHSLEMLCMHFAQKFHAETFYLNQKWEHLWAMVKKYDEEFAAIMESREDEFIDSEVADMSLEDRIKYFGSAHGPGYKYNPVNMKETTHYDAPIIVSDDSTKENAQ